MIDIREEELLTFGQAVNRLPKRASGKPLHPNTIWRWSKRGLKTPDGRIAKLETTKIGGTNCTSVEALQRFFNQLRSLNSRSGAIAPGPQRTQNRRANVTAAALQKIGI